MKRDYNCENISEGQQFHQIKKKKILKENYLSLQVIALKRRTTSAVGIPGYGLGQVQQCGVNSNQIQILSLPPFFCGVYVAQSAVFCVVFCRSLFFFCPFSFGHCIICLSIYGFWLLLWYFQTFLGHILIDFQWS